MCISAAFLFGCLLPLLNHDEHSVWLDRFRSDVMAFVSDDLNESRLAEERFSESLFDLSFLFHYHESRLSWIDAEITKKLVSKLDTHVESERTICCALLILSVAPTLDETAIAAMKKIMNSTCHTGLRTAAFKALCYKLPCSESVIEEIDDMWLAFDLSDHCAALELIPVEGGLNKYQGLETLIDDLVTTVQFTGRVERESVAIVHQLSKCDLASERIFCLLWMFTIKEHSEHVLHEVQTLQKDRNDDVRYLATKLLIHHSKDWSESDEMIKAGNLTEWQERQLMGLIKVSPTK